MTVGLLVLCRGNAAAGAQPWFGWRSLTAREAQRQQTDGVVLLYFYGRSGFLSLFCFLFFFYFLSLSLEFTLYPTLLPVLGLYRISTKAELELDSSAHACPMVKQVALARRIMSLFPWSDHREINQSLYIMRQLYELMIKFSYANCNSYAFHFQPEQIWHRLWPGQ